MVLATTETECTMDKIVRFVEAEESGKYSLSDSKLFDSVSGVSSSKKQQRELKKKEDEPPKGPGIHRLCGKKHHFGRCPKIKCYFCDEMGHNRTSCEKFKKTQGKTKGDKDTKDGEEAHEIREISDGSIRVDSRKALSELSGIYRSSIALTCRKGDRVLEVGSVNSARGHRKKLHHMRFDRTSGHFRPTERRKQNRMVAKYSVDREQYKKLSVVLNEGVVDDRAEQLTTGTVEKESVADTGATVVCGGTDIMQDLGLNLSELMPTTTTLFTADKKSLNVLGAVPVNISAVCENGGTDSTKEVLYLVEELTSVFLSKDAISNMGIIPKDFPRVKVNTSFGWVAHSIP